MLRVSTRQKLILTSVVLILIVVALLCTLPPSDKYEISYRTDIKPISDRFPSLTGINKVYWSSRSINDDFGPANYWIRGYVFLDQAAATNLRNAYKWENEELKPKMKFEYNDLPTQWSVSDIFNEKFVSSNLVGKFYLDQDSDVLYFDFER